MTSNTGCFAPQCVSLLTEIGVREINILTSLQFSCLFPWAPLSTGGFQWQKHIAMKSSREQPDPEGRGHFCIWRSREVNTSVGLKRPADLATFPLRRWRCSPKAFLCGGAPTIWKGSESKVDLFRTCSAGNVSFFSPSIILINELLLKEEK